MGNSMFFSFVLSLSIYLYWEYEKNDIECEFSTYLQQLEYMWDISVTNCEIMTLATDSPYMVLIL